MSNKYSCELCHRILATAQDGKTGICSTCRAKLNDLQLRAEREEMLGACGKLATLEDALGSLESIDLLEYKLHDDLRDVSFSLDQLIKKVEKLVQAKEQAMLEKWINGNEDWQRWQPPMPSDSIFHSRKRTR